MTMLNSFITSNIFVDSLDFSMHEITSYVNRDGLTTSFSFFSLLFLFLA